MLSVEFASISTLIRSAEQSAQVD